MLLQLNADLGNEPPHRVAEIAAMLGTTLSEVMAHGHKCELHVIDLSILEDSPPEPTPEEARGHGYATGFAAGFTEGWEKCGKTAGRTFSATDADLVDHRPPPGAMLAATLASLGNPGPSMNRHPGFPLPIHPDTPKLTSDPTALETTNVMPRYEDKPANLDDWQAAADARPEPAGERPKPGPGAPISAYEALTAEVAANAYDFPEFPSEGARHTDSEGAQWAYNGGERCWDRLSYPAEWGPAPAGDFRPLHLPTPSE